MDAKVSGTKGNGSGLLLIVSTLCGKSHRTSVAILSREALKRYASLISFENILLCQADKDALLLKSLPRAVRANVMYLLYSPPLKKVYLFSRANRDPAIFNMMLSLAEIRKYEPGMHLVEKGFQVHDFMILLEGEAKVRSLRDWHKYVNNAQSTETVPKSEFQLQSGLDNLEQSIRP
jgi:hypothetical protein